MIQVFSGRTADEAWDQAAEVFRKGKEIHAQASRMGGTSELLHVGFSIEDPRQRWVVSRFPPLNPAFAIAEVVWILNGRNDSAFLNYWNRELPKFAGMESQYYGAYGFRLRQHFELDQLERAYLTLKENSESRQVVLQIWDTRTDFPDRMGKPRSQDIPCNVLSLLKVRNRKLEWMQIIRSNDLFRGVPYNFVQFTFLQEVLASWLKIEVGAYNQISDSLHVYEESAKDISASKKIEVLPNTDFMDTSKEQSDQFFQELSRRIETFIQENLTNDEHVQLAFWLEAPQIFQNFLCILAAEAARRRKWLNLAIEIMNRCTNPALIQLWERWLMRVKK